MRFDGFGRVLIGLAASSAAGAACAQEFDAASWTFNVPVQIDPQAQTGLDIDRLARQADEQRLNRALFGGAQGLVAAQTRGVWRRQADGGLEGFTVTVSDPADSPLPIGAIERGRLEQQSVDFNYVRGFSVVGGDPDGVQVEFTPRAGLGVGSGGGTAEIGATIRVGEYLEVRDGRNYDEDLGRWYLFAAGNRRAVGLNWARGMDGGWDRQGITHDTGSYIGDAQVGVAWRQGDTQASFGYVHREYTAEGVHGGTGIDRDVTQGFVAFQFSIRPDW